MYEGYWGLREGPFEVAPSPRFLYLAPSHEEALVRLLYAVRHRKGYAVLSGEHGCGTTTVVRALLHRLEIERYEAAYLTNPGGGAVDLLREILYQLGGDEMPPDRLRVIHAIEDRCVRAYREGRDTLLVVDEAQRIDSDEALEELRLLTNLQSDDRPLTTLVLAGGPDLPARLAALPALDQRFAIRSHLGPLDAEHTARYVEHRLHVAGAAPGIFTPAALERVHDVTRGVPRAIGALCDLALVLGYQRRLPAVDADVVTEAGGDPDKALG